jgi:hypothetical protein
LESRIVLDISNVLANNPAEDLTVHQTQSETSITIAKDGSVIATSNDSGVYPAQPKLTGVYVSTDGGNTFSDKGTLPTNPGGDAGDPVLATDLTSGRVYLSTLGFNVSTIQVFRSNDNGQTWLAPVNGTPGGSSEDKEWITVDNYPGAGQENVYVISRRFGGSPGIYLFRSTNGGDTFGPSGGVLISNAGSVQGAWVTVGPDHAVYAFYYAGSSIQMRKSTDQGATFAAPVTVTPLSSSLGVNGDLGLVGIRKGTTSPAGFRSNAFPQAVVNPANANVLYVTYNDRGVTGDKSDVYMRISTNGGSTWGAAIRVNQDTTTRDQWQPVIAITPNGSRLFLSWYDRRLDPADNLICRWGVVGLVSADGGTVTFQPDFRIDNADTNGNPGFLPEFGRESGIVGTYMGDYDAATADNTGFYLTWGDNRSDNTVDPSLKNADVRFSKIQVANGLAGNVYNDVNGNGTKDPGEVGLAGWTVFLDLNNNGQPDPGEPTTTTDAIGNYNFSDLAPDTYHVREVVPPGWTQITPASGVYDVTITSDTDYFPGNDFGNQLVNPATISGEKFHDLNGNGTKDPGEPGLAGWTIFVDVNGDGKLDPNDPYTVTDANGNYTIGGLDVGTYVIREVGQPGWVQSAPGGDGSYTVSVNPGDNLTGFDFGNFLTTGSISGMKFNDINGNGVPDPGEPGLGGWTVYLDLNNNGQPDPGEPSAVTDANGNYTIPNLSPGTYVVREVGQGGWQQTAPGGDGSYTVTITSGQALTGIIFGNQRVITTLTTVDDLDPGFSTTGPDWNFDPNAGYNNGHHFHAAAVNSINNGGFEAGTFSGWTLTGGPNSIKTSSFGIPPTEGMFDALTDNGSGVATGTLETFLGVPSGSLNGLGNGPVQNGSAFKQTITAVAGQTLSFDWDLLTNEFPGDTTYDDFGFVSVSPVSGGGTLQTLAKVANAGSFTPAPSATGYGNHTGWHTFSYTFTSSGTFTLSFGAVNVTDTAVNSGLLIDNVRLAEANSAVWAVPPVDPGAYEVFVTWVPDPGNATDATYQVYDGSTLKKAVKVNQQVPPDSILVQNTLWKSLGVYTTGTGNLTVKLGLSFTGVVDADAIFVTPVATSPNVLTNGGFETGDFTGWTTIGSPNSIKTAAFGIPPTEGTYDALTDNGSGADVGTLETFLGVSSGSLSGLGNGPVTNGSAFKQTFTALAGMTLTFDWDFLTNEQPGDTTYDDFGFVSVSPVSGGGTLQTLAKVANASSFVPAPGSTGYSNHTGWHTFSYTFTAGGSFTLGFGAVNVTDTAVNSGLLIDNARVGSASMAGLALAGLNGQVPVPASPGPVAGVSQAPVPAPTGATSLAAVVPGLPASALDRVFASLPEAGQGVAVGHSRLGLPDWVSGDDLWQESPLGTDGRPL